MDFGQNVQSIHHSDAAYPTRVVRHLGDDAPGVIHLIGGAQSLQRVNLALICSVSCPGSVIIRTFDAIRKLRDAGMVVAGGYHSPVERECLHFLLRGPQQVILSPACGLPSFVAGPDEQRAVDEDRLSMVSIFDPSVTQPTPELASRRNDFVAALAEAILVPHAVVGGKAEMVARRALARGQVVLTFDDAANQHLLAHGAIAVSSYYQLPATG